MKIGRVVGVEPLVGGNGVGEVVLEGGERVKYDVLVLAPGSTWAGPLDFPDGREEVMGHLDVWRKKFGAAKAVVLVGGGSVSLGMHSFSSMQFASLGILLIAFVLFIEYAGELRDFYPSTKVTIVHNGSMLLNDAYPEKYRRRVERDARARGVDIVLEDRLDDMTPSSEGTVTTRNGKVLPGDLIVRSPSLIP